MYEPAAYEALRDAPIQEAALAWVSFSFYNRFQQVFDLFLAVYHQMPSNLVTHRYIALQAATGDVSALGVLLHRHPLSLRPVWLQLLDALPETLHPRVCSYLLPRVGCMFVW